MPDPNFSLCKAVVADPSPLIRQGVRNTLYSLGFREVRDTASYVALSEDCKAEVDLIIANAEVEGGDTSFLIRNLRAGKLGPDPFVVVITMLTNGDEAHIRKVADSGSDGLLLIPFAPDQLMQRVRMLTERRKPFVVTHNYLGPDRRKEVRTGGAGNAALFEVPNPLSARAKGAGGRYARLREEARQRLLHERVSRIAGGIEWECQSLYVAVRDGQKVPEDIVTRLFRVESNCEELVNARDLHRAGEVAELLGREVGRIKNGYSQASFRDYEGLYNHAQRLARELR
ncbi:MAG: response regulator [Pseudomonadota bacterium]